MKKLPLLTMAALAFAAAPYTQRLGPVTGALLLLALGAGLSIAASGAVAALAIAAGAVGAFASGVLFPATPAAAGAVLIGLAYAERTSRIRGNKERLLHIAVAVIGGALAGTLTTAFASSSLAVRIVAAIVAAVLTALPHFIDADDPLAHRLDTFAEDLSDPAKSTLRQGAELRRAADPSLLDRSTARHVKKTWAALLRLSEARLRLERSVLTRHRETLEKATNGPAARAALVVKRVDERMAEHVAALTRAYAAVDTAHAAEASLDDAALRSVESAGETLETMTDAIAGDV